MHLALWAKWMNWNGCGRVCVVCIDLWPTCLDFPPPSLPLPFWVTPPHVGYNANKSSLQAQAKALKKTVVTEAFVIFSGLSHFVLRILPLLWSTAPFWRFRSWVGNGGSCLAGNATSVYESIKSIRENGRKSGESEGNFEKPKGNELRISNDLPTLPYSHLWYWCPVGHPSAYPIRS